MAHERFSIEIEGEEINDLYKDRPSLEVELDDELAGMFRLRIPIQREDGKWACLDDERLVVWKQVTIEAGFEESELEELMSGYITHVKPDFGPDLTQCALEIWGMDNSVLMDREEKLKAWSNKKDSDIASEIFNSYGFTPEVEDTHVVHDEAISTTIQRETDIQFLKRLALRNGFECYVEGTTGYFRPLQVDTSQRPVLAVHFGDQENVNGFSIEVNTLTPTKVTAFQVDRANKEVLTAAVETGGQKALGSAEAASLLAPGMSGGRVYAGAGASVGIPEMDALCRGLFDQAAWFVTGEGEINANQYEYVLKPRQMVTIKGVGETYSGDYCVTHVTHSFTPDGYTQCFRVKRNALMPTGMEDFDPPGWTI